ncbi:uncharacterized protein METZ01_LOCUS68290 [marine metagenome]|uniref:Uncharacterized protein n=1 Tax=marine metagenome TaxID=408172 RepID=A0A381TH45_9ZZZZ
MKTIIWSILLPAHILFSQVCLIDGKDMFSVGSSEIVNGEHLLLFCCDDGHQMWLSNYNQHNKIKKINDENSKKRIVEVNSMISKDAISLLIANDIKAIKNDQIDNPAPIIKNETVLKKSSSNNSFSNSINIKKFGVETLLHKKMESDRIFEENLEDERSELLYMMNAQKKLFQQVTKKKAPLSISKILKSPIIFAYYTTAILAAILLI